MIRLVLFIALLMALSLLVAPLADNPGDLTLQWMGWQVETSVFALLFAVLLLVVAAITVFRVFEWLIHWPGQFKEHRTVHRHEKGLSVITEALAALAVSDIQSAKRLTKRADRLLDHAPISGLLSAQLAKLEGNEKEARAQLKGLLAHKETRFLAARNLLEQSRAEGNIPQAMTYAEQAENLRPDSAYATRALIDLYTHEKRWQQAMDVIRNGKKHDALSKEEAERYTAIINYLHAEHLQEHDDEETALPFARAAHKALPDMVPAALLLAKIYDRLGQRSKIASLFARSWKAFPHPSIPALYKKIYADESPAKRLKRMEKLVSHNPDNIESQITIGEAALEAKEFAKARNHLKIALSKQETPRICKLMAKLEEAEFKSKEKAEPWMERAVKADMGPAWTCDHCHAIVEKWSLHCPQCDSFDTIEWKVRKLNFVQSGDESLPQAS